MKGLYVNFLKVLFDVSIALVVLVLLFPLLIVIAILIRLESPGFPVFRQVRVGKGLQNFTMYKFRSMKLNDDKSFTEANDPRITKMGKFIRKTSLDEIPQLFNVLLLDMSLVGPRPCQPFEDVYYSKEDFVQRHSVRPGITGLHQVTYRSTGTSEDKARCDVEYTKRISFFFDLSLIFRTFSVLMGKKVN